MEFMLVLAFAIGLAIWLTRTKKEQPRTIKPVRAKGPEKGGCDTCGGNCGQCGSSH